MCSSDLVARSGRREVAGAAEQRGAGGGAGLAGGHREVGDLGDPGEVAARAGGVELVGGGGPQPDALGCEHAVGDSAAVDDVQDLGDAADDAEAGREVELVAALGEESGWWS